MVRTIAAAMALSCAAFAAPALANDEFVQVQGRVAYADLDLNSSSGVAEFDKRVARLASHICRRGVPKELQFGRLVNDCRASVAADARQKLAGLRSKQGAESQMASGE